MSLVWYLVKPSLKVIRFMSQAPLQHHLLVQTQHCASPDLIRDSQASRSWSQACARISAVPLLFSPRSPVCCILLVPVSLLPFRLVLTTAVRERGRPLGLVPSWRLFHLLNFITQPSLQPLSWPGSIWFSTLQVPCLKTSAASLFLFPSSPCSSLPVALVSLLSSKPVLLHLPLVARPSPGSPPLTPRLRQNSLKNKFCSNV